MASISLKGRMVTGVDSSSGDDSSAKIFPFFVDQTLAGNAIVVGDVCVATCNYNSQTNITLFPAPKNNLLHIERDVIANNALTREISNVFDITTLFKTYSNTRYIYKISDYAHELNETGGGFIEKITLNADGRIRFDFRFFNNYTVALYRMSGEYYRTNTIDRIAGYYGEVDATIKLISGNREVVVRRCGSCQYASTYQTIKIESDTGTGTLPSVMNVEYSEPITAYAKLL